MSTPEDDIEVKEEADGSVTVGLPENLAPEEDDQEISASENTPADDPADADADDDSEGLRAAKRARRRAKRELAKQTSIEKDQRLQLLQRQNEELLQRLSVIERKTHAGELAQLDEKIKEEDLYVEYAKRKMAQATSEQDGDAFTRAQEEWFEHRQRAEALRNIKRTATQPKQQNNLPDPKVQKMAANWINKHDWYDPQHKDTDSRIAKQIDEELTSEGWNPSTTEYWDELDSRLQRYLPHRYNQKHNDGVRSRPRNMQASVGREVSSGNRNDFTLSPEQVRAMKDAGFWEDKALRNKMIKRYAQERNLQRN